MLPTPVFLCCPTRSAIGAFNGSFKATPAVEIGARVIAAVLDRSGLAPSAIDHVIFGNVVQAGNRMNPARQAAINGGIPVSSPAYTVNRVCGSGAQAIVNAAQEIALGGAHAVIAGGMENMDRAPYLVEGGRWGHRLGHGQVLDSLLLDGLHDAFSNQHSGWHTEDLVGRLGISREVQDAWALRSQMRFIAARDAGLFAPEILPLEVPVKGGVDTFAVDEAPKPQTSAEALARLKPAFRPDGTITAGNAPGLNSGAAAVLAVSEGLFETLDLRPSARLMGYAVSAVEPGYFGLGPIPAIRTLLERLDWPISAVDRFEINEAYAAIPIAVGRELGIPEDRVNVEGGAIAHGHPIGATGAILVTRLIHAMARNDLRRGVVSLCIGGGQGIALGLERVR